MRVYRVENSYGDGPYQYTVRNEDGVNIGSAHANMAHPGPSEDGLYGEVWGEVAPFDETPHSDHLFGMNSLGSLIEWFDGWWDTLARHGYTISEYEVPEEYVGVGESGTQAVFVRSEAEHVAELEHV